MNRAKEQVMRNEFQQGFKDTFRNGLLQGSSAMCKVILDKANNTKLTLEERIADIVKFCETGLKSSKQLETK